MSVFQSELRILANSLKNEYGQGLMEYALILVLVSIASFAIMGLLGIDISTVFTTIEGKF